MTTSAGPVRSRADILITTITTHAWSLLRKVTELTSADGTGTVAPRPDPGLLAAELTELFDRLGTEIEQSLDELHGDLMVKQPESLSAAAELVAELRANWVEVTRVWETRGTPCPWLDPSNPRRGDRLTELTGRLRELVQVGISYVIPRQLDRELDGYRIGQSVDFVETFRRWAPEDVLRTTFTQIHNHPMLVPGVTIPDPQKPRVIKASVHISVRVLTWFVPVLAVGAGFAAIEAAAALGVLDSLHPGLTLRPASIALIFAVLGALFHLLVTYLKETRRQNARDESNPILGNWLMWLHVRYLGYTTSAFAVVVAAALAMWSVPRDQQPESLWLLFIAAGYSADSLLDTFLAKVPSLMAARSELISNPFGGGLKWSSRHPIRSSYRSVE